MSVSTHSGGEGVEGGGSFSRDPSPTHNAAVLKGSAPGAWHATLPIQINWTYRLDLANGCNAAVYCPGNLHPWRMASITAGSDESAEAYARLIAAAPDLLAVCIELMPKGISPANGNVPDSTAIPVDITMGELRRLAAAIAKAVGTAELAGSGHKPAPQCNSGTEKSQ